MIIQLKHNATKEQHQRVVNYFLQKNYEVKDVSSENVIIFGIIGDTLALDQKAILAFEGVSNVTRVSTPFKKASLSFKSSPTIIKFSNGIEIGGDQFVVMSGPCAVESLEQLDIIAKKVKESGSNILRGGAYKPRTSPYSFQGLEKEGLQILRKVADKYEMLVVTEIMDAKDIDLFVEYVDIIQVGARNMQNFALLKALSVIDIPVLLKRGMSATIEEWLMSAEYIMAGGNENVIMCERGIRTFEKYTRNTLDISAVLSIKELSHLPVVVDPSHAAGRFSMIEDLSLASLAVGAHGIIVEVHHDPENAASDGAQSLKPKKFAQMMNKINSVAKYFGKHL